MIPDLERVISADLLMAIGMFVVVLFQVKQEFKKSTKLPSIEGLTLLAIGLLFAMPTAYIKSTMPAESSLMDHWFYQGLAAFGALIVAFNGLAGTFKSVVEGSGGGALGNTSGGSTPAGDGK